MVRLKTWNGLKEIELLECPFCGHIPEIIYKGNNQTKKRSIEICCRNCRTKRIDAAIMNDFSWLEDVAFRNWNQRSGK